jgi:hypothetical protein
MICLDRYLDRTYSFTAYNCGHFVSEFWFDLTGEDISHIAVGFFDSSERSIAEKVPRFRQIVQPESPCVAIAHRYNFRSHAGVFYDGKVLHLSEQGVKYEDLNLFSQFAKRTLFYK